MASRPCGPVVTSWPAARCWSWSSCRFRTWYVMITKLVEQALLLSKAKKANATFWKAKTLKEGAKGLDQKSPFYFLAASWPRSRRAP